MQNDTHHKKMQQNIWKIFALRGIRSFSILLPVIAVFFIDRGLDQGQIFLLQALFGLVYLTLEIPSGYFADRFGRKTSIMIGTLFWVAGDILFINAYGFWELFAAEFMLGIAASLFSGADEALLHDSLRDMNKKDTYLRSWKNMFIVFVMMEGVAGLLGAYLFSLFDFPTLWKIQAGISALAIPIALTLHEPHAHQSRPLESIWSEIKRVIRLPAMPGFFTVYAVTYCTTLMMMWFSQPFMLELGMQAESFGLVWIVLLSLSAAGAHISPWVHETFVRRHTLLILIWLPIILYGSLALLPDSIWLLGVMALFWVQRGVQNPLMQTYLQELVEDTNRATALSMASASARILFLTAPILGSTALFGGFNGSFLITGITMTTIGLGGFWLYVRGR